MVKKLNYVRGDSGCVLELMGHDGRLEKKLIFPSEELLEPQVLNLGQDCTFINESAVPIQIDAFLDFATTASVVDYEGMKDNFVAIDPEFSGALCFHSQAAQSFDSRFLYPKEEVSLRGVLTLLAAHSASA